ncbi:hypothetical protein [Actinomadura sp. K4S16]|uniref:hypothetical protein n=1 Tax=Actinomadura sp. K4S16 TaxID=1316147 RepID=UPI0011EE9E3D|nr:hypothetical protein [Actinomadura sp. K4S16]
MSVDKDEPSPTASSRPPSPDGPGTAAPRPDARPRQGGPVQEGPHPGDVRVAGGQAPPGAASTTDPGTGPQAAPAPAAPSGSDPGATPTDPHGTPTLVPPGADSALPPGVVPMVPVMQPGAASPSPPAAPSGPGFGPPPGAGGPVPPDSGFPGAAFPQGGPVPPGSPRPGQKRKPRGRRVVVVAGAAAAVVVVGAVTAVALTGGEESAKKKPKPTASAAPPAWTIAAGRDLTSGTGLRYDGTVTVNGQPVQAHLRVTPAGAATGTLTGGVLTAEVVAVGGVTYLKAGTSFWQTYASGVAHPEYYAGRWSKAPASVPGFDVPDVLGPKAIAKALAKAPAKPPTEDVNGVRAFRVKTSDAEYVLTAAAPYRLLAVRPSGQAGPRFTAAPVAAPATLFAELRPRVARLGGASDPGLRFTPGTLTFSNCDQNTSGCTVSMPATLTEPATVPDGARAALRAAISSKGEPLGTCTGSGPVPANRSLVLRCTVTSKLWRHWMRAALDNPGSYPYEAKARVVGEALDVADVPKLLARVDKERKAVMKAVTATPGPAVSGEPSVKHSEGPEVATSQTPGTP